MSNVYDNILKYAVPQRYNISMIEKACNLSNGTIRVWKTGEPGAFKLKKVADLLGVSIDDLLDCCIEGDKHSDSDRNEQERQEQDRKHKEQEKNEVLQQALEVVTKLQEQNMQLQNELNNIKQKIALYADEK